jgi:WD40 repeat protein
MKGMGFAVLAALLCSCSTPPVGWNQRDASPALPDGAVARLGTTRFRHRRGDASIAVSPDGTRIATGGADAVLRIWDPETGAELRAIRGHRSTTMTVLFLPDGTRLVSGGQHDPIRVWNLSTGDLVLKIEPTQGYFSALALSPDGRTLATGTSEKIAWIQEKAEREQNGAFAVQLWDLATGQELRKLFERTWDGVSKDEGAGITSLGFSPDGRSLFAAGRHQPLRIWNLDTGAMATWPAPTTGNPTIAASPDGRLVAVGGIDNDVRLHDAQTGEVIRTLSGHQGLVGSLRFSPSGRLLATGSEDATASLWEPATGKRVAHFQGHTDGITGLAFSPDERTFVSCGRRDPLRFWNVTTGKEPPRAPGHLGDVLAVAFERDGNRIVSLGSDRTVRWWNPTSPKELSIIPTDPLPMGPAAFSRDLRRMAVGTEVHREAAPTVLLNPMTGRRIREIPDAGGAFGLAFTPDGKRLAVGGQGTVSLWDADEPRRPESVAASNGFVTGLAFSADGRTLLMATAASISYRGGGGAQTKPAEVAVNFWNVSGARRPFFRREMTTPAQAGLAVGFMAAALSDDGRWVAVADAERQIELWDTLTETPMFTLKGSRASISCLAFSPDSKRLVSGHSDGTLLIWSLEARR